MHQLRAPWMAWWLALALVVAPALGRMHEVLHATGLPQAYSAALSKSHSAHDWFGEHSALECLALDQLSYGTDGPAVPATMGHTAPTSAPFWQASAAARPTIAAIFEARAPPHVMAFHLKT